MQMAYWQVTLDLFVLTSMEGTFPIPQRATTCSFEGRSATTLGLVTWILKMGQNESESWHLAKGGGELLSFLVPQLKAMTLFTAFVPSAL